jgi:hypothetical protein
MYFYATGWLSMVAAYSAIWMRFQSYVYECPDFILSLAEHLIVFTWLIIGLWYATYDWNLEYSILKSNLKRSYILIVLFFVIALIPFRYGGFLILLLSAIDAFIVNNSFHMINRKLPEKKLEQVNQDKEAVNV